MTDLETEQERKTKKLRAKYQVLLEETASMRRDVKLLEVRMREKDHELKLADIKIKELKK